MDIEYLEEFEDIMLPLVEDSDKNSKSKQNENENSTESDAFTTTTSNSENLTQNCNAQSLGFIFGSPSCFSTNEIESIINNEAFTTTSDQVNVTENFNSTSLGLIFGSPSSLIESRITENLTNKHSDVGTSKNSQLISASTQLQPCLVVKCSNNSNTSKPKNDYEEKYERLKKIFEPRKQIQDNTFIYTTKSNQGNNVIDKSILVEKQKNKVIEPKINIEESSSDKFILNENHEITQTSEELIDNLSNDSGDSSYSIKDPHFSSSLANMSVITIEEKSEGSEAHLFSINNLQNDIRNNKKALIDDFNLTKVAEEVHYHKNEAKNQTTIAANSQNLSREVNSPNNGDFHKNIKFSKFGDQMRVATTKSNILENEKYILSDDNDLQLCPRKLIKNNGQIINQNKKQFNNDNFFERTQKQAIQKTSNYVPVTDKKEFISSNKNGLKKKGCTIKTQHNIKKTASLLTKPKPNKKLPVEKKPKSIRGFPRKSDAEIDFTNAINSKIKTRKNKLKKKISVSYTPPITRPTKRIFNKMSGTDKIDKMFNLKQLRVVVKRWHLDEYDKAHKITKIDGMKNTSEPILNTAIINSSLENNKSNKDTSNSIKLGKRSISENENGRAINNKRIKVQPLNEMIKNKTTCETDHKRVKVQDTNKVVSSPVTSTNNPSIIVTKPKVFIVSPKNIDINSSTSSSTNHPSLSVIKTIDSSDQQRNIPKKTVKQLDLPQPKSLKTVTSLKTSVHTTRNNVSSTPNQSKTLNSSKILNTIPSKTLNTIPSKTLNTIETSSTISVPEFIVVESKQITQSEYNQIHKTKSITKSTNHSQVPITTSFQQMFELIDKERYQHVKINKAELKSKRTEFINNTNFICAASGIDFVNIVKNYLVNVKPILTETAKIKKPLNKKKVNKINFKFNLKKTNNKLKKLQKSKIAMYPSTSQYVRTHNPSSNLIMRVVQNNCDDEPESILPDSFQINCNYIKEEDDEPQ